MNKSLIRLFLAIAMCIATIGSVFQTANAFTAARLTYGSKGYDVYELQNRLRFIGYYWGKIDGEFGWETYWAVRTFQYNFGLPISGKVNMDTKIKLVKSTTAWHYTPVKREASVKPVAINSVGNQAVASPADATAPAASAAIPNQVQGVSSSDISLIAHIVYAEARGETFRGQVAIAAVILNRLHKPQFPHTISGIIYQPGAFTSVQDGQVNLQPDQQAVQAAMAAVHGTDPSLGAIYYFNPATASNAWMWSRPQLITIGHHIFCD